MIMKEINFLLNYLFIFCLCILFMVHLPQTPTILEKHDHVMTVQTSNLKKFAQFFFWPEKFAQYWILKYNI